MQSRSCAASHSPAPTVVLLLATLMVGLLGHPATGQETQAFYCINNINNPTIQAFVVPQGTSELQIIVQGAHGSNPGNGAAGGFGGFVQATLAVTPGGPLKPGQALDIWVGCYGDSPQGYGYGGTKGTAPFPTAGDGGYGGGGSAIVDHVTQAPLSVAGGGGGGGGS